MPSLVRHLVAVAVLAFAFMPSPAADESPAEIGGKSLDKWVERLTNTDPAVREQAVRIIPQFGPPAQKAASALVPRITDPDIGVSGSAIVAFRALATEKDLKNAVPALTKALTAPGLGPSTRMQAALLLAQAGPEAKAAIKPLIDNIVAARFSWEMRKAGALALGHVALEKSGPDAAAVRALGGLLKDDCSQVRLQAIMSIGTLQAHVAPTTAGIVKSPLDLALRTDRDAAVQIWGRVLEVQVDKGEGKQAENNLGIIVNYLQKSKDPQTRGHALQALAVLGSASKPKVPLIIDALKDEDAGVTSMAAGALGKLREQLSDRQIAAIAKLLEEKSPLARASAAQALGLLGDKAKEYLPSLIDLLKDPDAGEAGAGALVSLKDDLSDAHLAAVAKLLVDKDELTRCQAARALGALGARSKAHVPDLMTMLEDKQPSVALCAIVALAQLGKAADRAVPALEKLKDNPDETIKEAAAKAIEAITGKAAAPEKDK